jgi:RNA polymerase sigma-70 factor (family 1)
MTICLFLDVSTSPLHNEKELLMEIASGDERAFRSLFDHYRRKVYFVAWRLLQAEGEAEDVLQEVFTKVWVNREKLAEVDSFKAYLNTLLRNHIYNCLRKKANEENFLLETLKDGRAPGDAAHHRAELNELHLLLQQAVNTLPPQQKKVFQLGRLEGRKHEEIAEELGISRETVKKHMMAALQAVKDFLRRRGKVLLVLMGSGI